MMTLGLINMTENIDLICELALGFEEKDNTIKVLSALSEHFSEEVVRKIPDKRISLGLDIVDRGLKKDEEKTRFLSALAPCLTVGLFPTALRLIKAIDEEDYRADALWNLAPYIPEGQFSEAINLTKNLKNYSHQIDALEGLIPYLSIGNLSDVLSIIEEKIEKNEINKQTVLDYIKNLAQVASKLAAEESRGVNIDQASTQTISDETNSEKSQLTSKALDLTKKIVGILENKINEINLDTFKDKSDKIDKIHDKTTDILKTLWPVLTEEQKKKLVEEIRDDKLLADNKRTVILLRKLAPFISDTSEISDIFENCISNLQSNSNTDFYKFSIQVYTPEWLSKEWNRTAIQNCIQDLDDSEQKAELLCYLAINSSRQTNDFYVNQDYLDALQKLGDLEKEKTDKKLDLLKLP